MAGIVHRYPYIRMRYWNEKAEPRSLMATGYLAGLFQHEVDHLDGTLFVDLIEKQTLSFIEELSEEAVTETCNYGTIRFE